MRRFFSILVVIVWSALLLGQETASVHLFMPALQALNGAALGIALSNPTLEATSVALTARAYDGTLIAGDGITNPVYLPLPAQGQRAQTISEIFGAGIS